MAKSTLTFKVYPQITAKKFFIALLGSVVIGLSSVKSQDLELGLGGGLSMYQGDLTSYRLFDDRFLLKLHPSFNTAIQANISEHFALRLSVFWSTLSGADSLASAPSTVARNFDFHSPISELSLSGLWFPFSGLNSFSNKIFPFISFGVAVFTFDPRTYYNNRLVSLQPLRTEGQGLAGNPKPYSLVQFAIPFGGGLRMRLTDDIVIQGFLNYSYTRTDYIDDVSTLYVEPEILAANYGRLSSELSNRSIDEFGNTVNHTGKKRANPATKDAYINGGVMLLFRLFDISKQASCPRF